MRATLPSFPTSRLPTVSTRLLRLGGAGLLAAACALGVAHAGPQAVAQAAAQTSAHASPTISAQAQARAIPTRAQLCSAWVSRLPQLDAATCQRLDLQATDGRSVEGRVLWQIDRPAAQPAHRRVLVLGAIHGDEMSSASLALHWSELARGERRDVHWRFIPVVNPDGLFRGRPTRTNARGVDLNRNFPTREWQSLAPKHWVERTRRDPRRFPGRQPLSEPESVWLDRQIREFRPDLIVSIHAPYGVLDFDGPIPAPQKIGGLVLEPVGVYPGSLGNYGGLQMKLPVITIELREAGRLPPAPEVQRMWSDMRQWMSRQLPPGATAQSTPAQRGG